MRRTGLGLALGAILLTSGGAALAQDSIYIPMPTYRTGPFAGSGIPISNGIVDYLNMLNERDGGIGGVKLVVEECETGYNTQRGVECYEQVKSKNPIVFNPWSTGTTLPLIPRVANDKIPILSMAYGLSAAAVGDSFPWVFNPPATYWDGASSIIRFIADQEGGFDKLKGKKIGYVFLDAGYGREPIPLLEQFATQYGFQLLQYPVPADQMQNQSSQWLGIRRDRADWVFLQGWGAMNPTAIREAAKVRFPMNKFVSIWWPNEEDVRPVGEDAKGMRQLNWTAVGQFPAHQDIIKHVVDTKKSQVTDKSKVGESLYNKGLYNAVLIAEGIRTAQQLTGKKVITGEDMRRGLENLNITPARWKEIGLEGFAPEVKLSCSDHSGQHKLYVMEWDGKAYKPVGDYFDPMKDVVRSMLVKAAEDYTTKNQPWPKRADACG